MPGCTLSRLVNVDYVASKIERLYQYQYQKAVTIFRLMIR